MTVADGSWQDYTVTMLFATAVNSVWNTDAGSVLSSYWKVSAGTSTDANEVFLDMTCDAINAGSDTLTGYLYHGNPCCVREAYYTRGRPDSAVGHYGNLTQAVFKIAA